MGMDGKKTKLKSPDICKVDLVPAGAQQHSRISIFKSDDNILSRVMEAITKVFVSEKTTEPSDLLGHALSFYELVAKIAKSTDENKAELIQGAADQLVLNINTDLNNTEISKISFDKLENVYKSLENIMNQKANAFDNKEPDKAKGKGSDQSMAEINKSALSQDVQDYISSLEATIAKSAKTEEDIFKGLPENVAKILKETMTKNKEQAEQIAKMSDEKVTKEYVAKASEYTNLSQKPEEFGLILKSIATAVPDAYSKLDLVLKAANEAIQKGNLFGENGSGATGNSAATAKDEAWLKIVALAEARVTKKESATQAQAIDEVIKTEEGRKLYSTYTGR